ncbi:hypothetical protein [Streptomyces sp. NPDC017890]|uniref:hypothetical protein n=1 Tax=Streptomyces sp. NPDC017890 TaxID=3365015 RepID=UPI0037B04E43
MRPLYVPVRLAVTAVAVAAVAGCMSVGDDVSDGSVKPSHSAGERGGEVSGGGPAVSGSAGYGAAAADEGRGREKGKKGKGDDGRGKGRSKGEAGKGEDTSLSAPPPARPDGTPPGTGGDDAPAPTRTPPAEPTRTVEPQPTPTDEPPATPTPEPTVAEPSSSAHEPPGTQLAHREPAPEAGVPV